MQPKLISRFLVLSLTFALILGVSARLSAHPVFDLDPSQGSNRSSDPEMKACVGLLLGIAGFAAIIFVSSTLTKYFGPPPAPVPISSPSSDEPEEPAVGSSYN